MNYKIILFLLSSCTLITVSKTNHKTNEEFFEAIKSNNKALVDKLIRLKKVDPNDQKDGKTALMWAIENHHNWMIIILIGLGADVNKVADNGETPLSFAAIYYPRAMSIIEDSHRKIAIPPNYENYIEYKKELLARGKKEKKKELKKLEEEFFPLEWEEIVGEKPITIEKPEEEWTFINPDHDGE